MIHNESSILPRIVEVNEFNDSKKYFLSKNTYHFIKSIYFIINLVSRVKLTKLSSVFTKDSLVNNFKISHKRSPMSHR